MKAFFTILLIVMLIRPGYTQRYSETESQRFSQRYTNSYSQWYSRRHARRYPNFRGSSPEQRHSVLSVDFIGRHLTFIGLSYEYQIVVSDRFTVIPKAGISLFSPGRFHFGAGLAYGLPSHKIAVGLSYYFTPDESLETLSLSFEYRFIEPRSGFFAAAGGYFPFEWGFLMPGISLGKAF